MISKVNDNVNFNDSHDDDYDRLNYIESDGQSYDYCLDYLCRFNENSNDCRNQIQTTDDECKNYNHNGDLKVEFSSLVKTSSSTHPLNNFRVCSVLMYLINLYLSSTSPSRRMTSSLDFVIFSTLNCSFDDSSQSFVIVI